MKRILAASVALITGMVAVNQPATRKSTVEPPAAVVALPVECCGDDCQCCDNCDCDGCEQPAKMQDAEPAKVATKVRDFGHIEIINGLAHRMVARWKEGDVWKYHYEPISQPAQTLPSVASGTYSGSSQWTYPGTIDGHLTSTHGLSRSQLAGKSKQELERLHDSLHNATRYAPAQSVYRQPVMQSNCPGGVCPQPQRRGWFR
jgi:hypothetical protein